MSNKGFAEVKTNIETPNDFGSTEKHLKSKRVDINILKSKLQKIESKEFKKNVLILSVLAVGLASLGIYLSL